jgi:hypothetical protein
VQKEQQMYETIPNAVLILIDREQYISACSITLQVIYTSVTSQ